MIFSIRFWLETVYVYLTYIFSCFLFMFKPPNRREDIYLCAHFFTYHTIEKTNNAFIKYKCVLFGWLLWMICVENWYLKIEDITFILHLNHKMSEHKPISPLGFACSCCCLQRLCCPFAKEKLPIFMMMILVVRFCCLLCLLLL